MNRDGNLKWSFVAWEFCAITQKTHATNCYNDANNLLVDVTYVDVIGKVSTYQCLMIVFVPFNLFFREKGDPQIYPNYMRPAYAYYYRFYSKRKKGSFGRQEACLEIKTNDNR